MEDGNFDKRILQGHVYDEPDQAHRATYRAKQIIDELRSRDLILRAGWWGPPALAAVVAGIQVLRGSGLVEIGIWAVVAFGVNAVVYGLRRRQLARIESSLEGNRAAAERRD